MRAADRPHSSAAPDCTACDNSRGAIIDFEDAGAGPPTPVWGPCPACNPDGRLLPQP